MSQLVGIDHVQLAMPPGGEDKARQFYRAILGFNEVPKPPELAARGGCWFELPGLKLHLGVETDFRPAQKAHPALLVDHLASLMITLTEAGHPPQPDSAIDGRQRCYVADPFGNRLELLEATPRS